MTPRAVFISALFSFHCFVIHCDSLPPAAKPQRKKTEYTTKRGRLRQRGRKNTQVGLPPVTRIRLVALHPNSATRRNQWVLRKILHWKLKFRSGSELGIASAASSFAGSCRGPSPSTIVSSRLWKSQSRSRRVAPFLKASSTLLLSQYFSYRTAEAEGRLHASKQASKQASKGFPHAIIWQLAWTRFPRSIVQVRNLKLRPARSTRDHNKKRKKKHKPKQQQ